MRPRTLRRMALLFCLLLGNAFGLEDFTEQEYVQAIDKAKADIGHWLAELENRQGTLVEKREALKQAKGRIAELAQERRSLGEKAAALKSSEYRRSKHLVEAICEIWHRPTAY